MADNKVHMNAQIPALHNQQALEALEFHSVFTVYNGGGVRGSRPGWRKKLRGSRIDLGELREQANVNVSGRGKLRQGLGAVQG